MDVEQEEPVNQMSCPSLDRSSYENGVLQERWEAMSESALTGAGMRP